MFAHVITCVYIYITYITSITYITTANMHNNSSKTKQYREPVKMLKHAMPESLYLRALDACGVLDKASGKKHSVTKAINIFLEKGLESLGIEKSA